MKTIGILILCAVDFVLSAARPPHADMPRFKSISLITASLFLLMVSSAIGQKLDTKKLETVVERSNQAADIVKTLAALPHGEGIPKEVLQKAQIIGVVPNAFRLSLLIASGVRGHGVFSLKGEHGWDLPVSFFYSGSNYGPKGVSSKSIAFIFIFINPSSKDLFVDKKAKIRAAAGPVETSSKDAQELIEKADLLIYTLSDGKLAGTSVAENQALVFIPTPNLLFDDDLNKSLYGATGKEILGGRSTNSNSAVPTVSGFPDALNTFLPVSK
jgi:lipid-binding SYLF domain-containing protein